MEHIIELTRRINWYFAHGPTSGQQTEDLFSMKNTEIAYNWGGEEELTSESGNQPYR
jgi:hypothetical protein